MDEGLLPGRAVLGVLGGMGPAATADFLARLARLTPAERDQDHVPVIVYSDPGTPGRPEAIRGQGPSPLAAMLRGVEFLERSGCALIAMPCNTAHYWYENLASVSGIPIVNMVDACAGQLGEVSPQPEQAGLLATDALIETGLYADRLAAYGVKALDLSGLGRADPVREGIAQVKRGDLAAAHAALTRAGDELARRGADVLLAACSDVSAALPAATTLASLPLVDASDCLARAALRMLGVIPESAGRGS